MRRFLQKILKQPVITLANKFSSRPDKKRVDKALTELYRQINSGSSNKGQILPYDAAKDKFIIFSDQHKGARDGADIFALANKNYLAALGYYFKNDFFYINLGDSEELWENLIVTVEQHNKATFAAERKFLDKKKFTKIYGNHDLYWDNAPLAAVNLEKIYGQKVNIYEGIILMIHLDKRAV